MKQAGTVKRLVRGLANRLGVDIVRYPDSYSDARGVKMWNEVLELLEQYRRLKAERGRVAATA